MALLSGQGPTHTDLATFEVNIRPLEKIKREYARWRGEVEIAEWMTQEHEVSFEDRRVSFEEAEKGGWLLRAPEPRLSEAIDAVYGASSNLRE